MGGRGRVRVRGSGRGRKIHIETERDGNIDGWSGREGELEGKGEGE